MTILEKQRHEKDCFLCCLAMAAGISYNEASGRWGAEFVAMVAEKGLYGGRNIERAFDALNLKNGYDYITPDVRPYSATYVRNLLWGRRACVQVPSKNNPGESHIVYWDGVDLFDPSNKLTYTWEEVQPENVWLFNERRVLIGAVTL